MKHLLPFVTGFVTFMIISSAYYMGLTEMPEGVCFRPMPHGLHADRQPPVRRPDLSTWSSSAVTSAPPEPFMAPSSP